MTGMELDSATWCRVSCDTLIGYSSPIAKPRCHIIWPKSNFSKETAATCSAMSGSEDTCCPLSLWCLQCCTKLGGHSAGCRTSWVCLQHHATVVTSNGVTVCGSKFPPTVSKHRPHQHSATHKTMQQYATPTIPAVVISKMLLPQPNFMAAFVYSCSSLVSDVSPGLPTYNNQKSQNLQYNQYCHLLVNSSGSYLDCIRKYF